jgi:hypothetical protein
MRCDLLAGSEYDASFRFVPEVLVEKSVAAITISIPTGGDSTT